MGTFTLLIILAGIAYGTFRIYSSLERHMLEIERQLGDIHDELKGAKSAMIVDTQGDIRDEPKSAKSAMIIDTRGDIRDEPKSAKSAMIMDTRGDIRDEPKSAKSAMIMDTQSEAKAIPDAFAEIVRPSSIEKLSSTAEASSETFKNIYS